MKQSNYSHLSQPTIELNNLRLAYLAELSRITCWSSVQRDHLTIGDRIIATCDALEKDLGIERRHGKTS